MSTLQEKEIVLKFKIAGYDLDYLDYNSLHNALMFKATEDLAMFAVVADFKSEVNDKKVKP